jgi:hypothetical protein
VKGSVIHLFFECCVAKAIWIYTREFLGMEIGFDYSSVAVKWLSAEIFYIANVISSAVMRGLWLIRNDFVFNNQVWSDVRIVLKKIWKLSMEWSIICKSFKMVEIRSWLFFPGEIDTRAIEDNKRLKLCRSVSLMDLKDYQVSSLA